MKKYILTYRHPSFYGTTLSRCRFSPIVMLWPYELNSCGDAVLAFMHLCCVSRTHYPYRLSSCGCLVARSATYQGV